MMSGPVSRHYETNRRDHRRGLTTTADSSTLEICATRDWAARIRNHARCFTLALAASKTVSKTVRGYADFISKAHSGPYNVMGTVPTDCVIGRNGILR